MEEQQNQLAVTHFLQRTLRSLCIHENSQWVYAVFWRILPRNYPPPKWDSQGGAFDRSRGNRRNWILVWEDGFCNFGASSSGMEMEGNEGCQSVGAYGNHEYHHQQPYQAHASAAGLQPELFFKMSHDIYNYGEGLIGKVAVDHSHKWINKEPNEQEINFLSAWNNLADSHPRTWEAQFQSGIKTIALIAVREGVIQLGSIHKKEVKLYREHSGGTIASPFFTFLSLQDLNDHTNSYNSSAPDNQTWQFIQANNNIALAAATLSQPDNLYHHFISHPPVNITPSMSSLEALLSKLPSVPPTVSSTPQIFCEAQAQAHADQSQYMSSTTTGTSAMELMSNEKAAKEENDDEENNDNTGQTSSSVAASYARRHREHFSYHHHHPDLNVVTTSSLPNNGY